MKNYQAIDELKQDTYSSRLTFATLKKILKEVEKINPRQNLSILDLGCGPGFWLEFLAQRFRSAKLVGADLQAECFDRRLSAKYPQIKFVRADALKLPFRSGSFDLVLSLDVVEHFPTQKQAFRAYKEAQRVLRPGGVLIIQTPNRQRLSMRVREIFAKRRWPYHLGQHKVLGEIIHYREYCLKELADFIRSLGFTQVQAEAFWLGLVSPGNGNWGLAWCPKVFQNLAQLLFLVAKKD